MDGNELLELFRSLESARVERKASLSNADRVRQAICAFANDVTNSELPGVIFVGQNDDLSCAGLEIDDRLLLTLSGMRSDGRIQPFPVMEVERKILDDCTVAVVIVHPASAPPVRDDGRTWIRVGPRRAIATVEEERRLVERQLWRNLTFDAKPFAGAQIEHLDLGRFEGEYVPSAISRDARIENGRSTEEKLRALRLTAPDGTPTAASLLLVGKDPRAFIPGAYVQFIRFAGPELTDAVLDQKEVSGTLGDQIRQTEELMRLSNRTPATIGVGTRQEEADFPVEALIQIFRNAILHRSYESSHAPVKVYWFSDRVEVHSSGGLYGDVNPETIWRNVTSYRNPLIAEGLKALGFVERFGLGLSLARKSLFNSGYPALEWDFVPNFVQFTIRGKT